MSYQVQMACTKCGRNEGYLQAIRNFNNCEAPSVLWFVPVAAGCSACNYKIVKFVNIQACWNLLRSVAACDVMAAERCSRWYSVEPRVWKLWSSVEEISVNELGLRYSLVKKVIDAFLPGDDLLSAQLSSWDYDPRISVGDRLWRFSRYEWVSLFRAITSCKRDTVHSGDIVRPLLDAMVGH
jgi:hypothetical protein